MNILNFLLSVIIIISLSFSYLNTKNEKEKGYILVAICGFLAAAIQMIARAL